MKGCVFISQIDQLKEVQTEDIPIKVIDKFWSKGFVKSVIFGILVNVVVIIFMVFG